MVNEGPGYSPGLFIWNLGLTRNIPKVSGMFRVPEKADWYSEIKRSRPAIERSLQRY
jgi:hypothetical protein